MIAELDTDYRSVWATPAPLRPSEWAEKYRTLNRRQSSRPGRWSNDAAPCLAGLMDLCVHPRVRKLHVIKAGQIGVSEAMRNVVGYLGDREPDPSLIVLPNEAMGRGIFADRILPLFEDTARLRPLMSDRSRDATLSQVVLTNGFTLRLGWSGSPTSQASHPVRFVWCDETDKFAPWAGNEADPISLSEIRTTTYANSVVVCTSTPTTRDGMIFRLYDGAPVKIAYHAPCPHCGKFQPLVFDRVKWDKIDITDKNERAAAVLSRGAAWYECAGCNGKIGDAHRGAMLRAGYWTSADGGYRLYPDGREVGELPVEAEIGAHLSALHSLAPKHRFAQVAAEWIRCDGDPMRTQNFRNSWLGEVFEVLTANTATNVIRDKASTAPSAHVVPSWAVALVATADTQKDHFWFTIRAWGWELKSQLVHYGMCQTFEELYRVCLGSAFPVDGQTGQTATPSVVLIDTGGNRTSEVYQFALSDTGRIIPCKGATGARMQRPWTMHPQPSGIVLRMLDVDYYKDLLHRLINDPDAAKWLPHDQVADDYCHQVIAEHKVFDRKRRKEIWTPRTSGAANHLGDCEVLQCAAADMGNFAMTATSATPTNAAPTTRPQTHYSPFAHQKRW